MSDKLYEISNNGQIVRALQEGNQQAFETIYKAYSVLLRRYAYDILKDADDAYEVVQDVFVAVWLRRKMLDETKSLRNYLLRSVHNNALRLLQMEELRKQREEKAIQEIKDVETETSDTLPVVEALIPAIERLPEQSRKVLQMSFWEEKKNAMIAEELSISVRTVETILYKVKKKLRNEFRKS